MIILHNKHFEHLRNAFMSAEPIYKSGYKLPDMTND